MALGHGSDSGELKSFGIDPCPRAGNSRFMRVFLAAAAVLASAPLSHSATAVTFGPVRAQPGQSVRLVTHSETPGGTIQQNTAGKNTSGTLQITRDRELFWTFREPAADGSRRGMVRVGSIVTETRTRIDGKDEKATDESPLSGKMFAMTRSPKGDWKFDLDGSIPLTRIRQEIEELTVYLKRDWYPAREVKVGDSWEFDPAWVKMIIGKDLKNAQTIGTMRLRQVRSGLTGRYALLDVSVRSTGADYKADGSEVSATVELTGEVTVDLDTMLDEKLELKGMVTTRSRKPGESTTVNLPIRLKATKSFVRGGP